MPRYAMIIEPKKCVGCFACRVACQNQNELPVTNQFIRFEDKEEGVYPNVTYTVYPLQCQHCANAPCVSVCPTTASHKDPATGVTLVTKDKCMGCRRCIGACPYNSRTYIRQESVVQACNLCLEHVKKGEEPACVSTCLTKCRTFGDLDNPQGEFAKLLPKAKHVRTEFGTQPTLLYII